MLDNLYETALFAKDVVKFLDQFCNKNSKVIHLCYHAHKKRARKKNKNRYKQLLCKYLENSMEK